MPITKEEIERYQKAYNEGHPLIDDSEFDALLEEYLKEHGESVEENNEEKWMPIKYKNVRKGMYEVSNYGNIRRVDNKREMRKNLRGGYYSVKLCISGIGSKRFPVHRLVAHAFVKGQSSENNIVNHLDGNKLNDVWSNLEWCNPRHNVIHAYLTGLNKNRGEASKLSKITNPIAEKICELLVENNGDIFKVSQILSRNNISCSYETIRAIKGKQSWRWLSNKYFVKDEYKKQRMFADCDVRKICQTLIKYKGDISMVYDELKDTMHNLKPYHVSDIKNKKAYKDISDSYFDYTTFIDSNKIPTEQLDLVRELLITNVMKGSPSKVYDSLNHEKYYKLTLAVIKMISAGNHDIYNRSDIYDLNEYYSDKNNCKYRPISKILLNKLLISYSSGNPDITDIAYDELLEDRIRAYGESERPYLRSSQTDSISDIVGTLPKAFGVTKPMRPGLLTYEEFVKKNPIPLDDYSIILQPKFDGISIAYDIIADRFYTRGDMTNNESVDVTDLFKHHSFHNEWTKGYDAIKFEAIMSVEVYEELYSSKYKRPRDAAQAAISSRNIEACKDITLIPLRKIKNKKLYVADILKRLSISFEQMHGGIPELTYDAMDGYIANLLEDDARLEFNGMHYECDGVVASHCKPSKTEIISKEVAIKILNLQKQTTLKGIEFSMGIAGRITPVAIVEDTKFGNVTVNRISLSNLERLRELNLNLGDTVNIMYNIIPYLVSSEHDGTLGKIQIPNICPICGSQLTNIGPNTLGCGNPNCYASNVGNVVKYVQNMKMFGISTRTIEAMFETGHIHSISSLYEINYVSLSALEGFGVVSADNVRKSIEEASTDVDPIRWLSALPCKNVERRKWEMIVYTNPKYRDNLVLGNVLKQVCSQSTPNQFFDAFGIHPNNDKVVGIGPTTMNIIITDIQRCWEDIMKIIPHITFKATTNIIDLDKPLAVLSGTRDGQVISKLESLGYRVSDKFSKDAKLVVIPNPIFTSSKVDKAKKYGIEVKTVNQIQNMGV